MGEERNGREERIVLGKERKGGMATITMQWQDFKELMLHIYMYINLHNMTITFYSFIYY